MHDEIAAHKAGHSSEQSHNAYCHLATPALNAVQVADFHWTKSTHDHIIIMIKQLPMKHCS